MQPASSTAATVFRRVRITAVLMIAVGVVIVALPIVVFGRSATVHMRSFVPLGGGVLTGVTFAVAGIALGRAAGPDRPMSISIAGLCWVTRAHLVRLVVVTVIAGSWIAWIV